MVSTQRLYKVSTYYSVPKWHFFSGSHRDRRSRETLLCHMERGARKNKARAFFLSYFS